MIQRKQDWQRTELASILSLSVRSQLGAAALGNGQRLGAKAILWLRTS